MYLKISDIAYFDNTVKPSHRGTIAGKVIGVYHPDILVELP
jgi:hypothetical protein